MGSPLTTQAARIMGALRLPSDQRKQWPAQHPKIALQADRRTSRSHSRPSIHRARAGSRYSDQYSLAAPRRGLHRDRRTEDALAQFVPGPGQTHISSDRNGNVSDAEPHRFEKANLLASACGELRVCQDVAEFAYLAPFHTGREIPSFRLS